MYIRRVRRNWRVPLFVVVMPSILMIISLTVVAKPTAVLSSSNGPTPLTFGPSVYADAGQVPLSLKAIDHLRRYK
jgi:hypothetical protein